MTVKEQIMKLQTYKMFENEDTVYVERDDVLKALEQEPSNNNWKFYYDHGYAQAKRDLLCENCISREAVLMEIDKYMCGVPFDEKGIDEVIKDLPPVTPQTRWIPCSERLPEENITVIGTTKIDDIYKTELYDDCGEKKWYANGNFDVPIIAWMPLPQPYKGESEERNEKM